MDDQQFKLSKKFITQFRNLLEQKNKTLARKMVQDLHPVEIAEILVHINEEEQVETIFLLPTEQASDVLSEMDPGLREDLLALLNKRDISAFIEEMDAEDAADVITELEDEVADAVLATLEPDTSTEVKKLLKYPEDSAGGIMSPVYVAVKESDTKEQVVNILRERKEDDSLPEIYSIFVVSMDQKLVGKLMLQDIILAQDADPIKDYIIEDVIHVHTHIDQEEAAKIAQKYDLVVIPVVDDHHNLVGRLTFDDVQDVIQMEILEDQGIMSGTGSEEVLEKSVVKTMKDRIPWLIFGLFGGILSALVIRVFQPAIDQMIALAFFIPVVASTAGNISIQSSSITVRGLATGEIQLLDTWRRIFKELKVAIINGVIISITLAVVTALWFSDVKMATVLASSIFIVSLVSGVLGSMIPLILFRFNIDPANATGPFITTANDILGLFIYLSIFSLYLYTL